MIGGFGTLARLGPGPPAQSSATFTACFVKCFPVFIKLGRSHPNQKIDNSEQCIDTEKIHRGGDDKEAQYPSDAG